MIRLTASEKIAKGKWSGKVDESGKIFISLEQSFAKNNSIEIGDTMIFNVQGSVISTIVGSLREVDWDRVQTNFLVVFPTGVLEEAPQFHVLLTRITNKDSLHGFSNNWCNSFPMCLSLI